VPFEADEGIIAAQRILLDPATGEKRYHAALREAKLTLGLVRHAAMRIGGQPTGDVLRLAEGFEEAVSVTQLSDGKFKVWRWRHSPLWPDRDPRTHPQNRHLLATRPGSRTGHRGRARPPHCQRPRTENHPPASPGADGLERHSSGESGADPRFQKWPRNQQIALPILSVFAFGALFNQMQARNSEPVSIHVENPRIIDGDTLETLDKKRVRLSGIDAPDEDGKGNVPKIAAQLYLKSW
jgi:hypothetical protein